MPAVPTRVLAKVILEAVDILVTLTKVRLKQKDQELSNEWYSFSVIDIGEKKVLARVFDSPIRLYDDC